MRSLGRVVSFEHGDDVLCRDMVMEPEAAAKAQRDVHHLMDDHILLIIGREPVEPFGDEFEGVERLDPHRDLQDLAHPVTPGDDSPGRGSEASDADDLSRIDVPKIQRSNDILEPLLDIPRERVGDLLRSFLCHLRGVSLVELTRIELATS